MKSIFLPDQPLPRGHYAPAAVAGGLVFVSGQLPWGVEGPGEDSSIEFQVRECLAKIDAILAEAGTNRYHIVKVSGYLTNGGDWGAFNQVFAEWMGDHRPARIVLPVGPLNHGAQVEVECIAAMPVASSQP